MNCMLSESLQDYLESILIVLQKKPVCRITDIQKIMNVSKPSIVNAVSILKDKSLVNKEKYGYITLTDKGKERAEYLYKKHVSIRKFLCTLFNLEKSKSDTIACGIEHHLDMKLIDQMNIITDNIKSHPDIIHILKGEK